MSTRCIKKLGDNFNEANKNIKNMIDFVSKDNSMKETLLSYTLEKHS